MTGRARAGVLAACAVVVLLAAWYAGAQVPASEPAPVTGSVRLGPEPGEEVAAYLQRLPAELPASGTAALALVQFTAELPASAAVPAVAGTTPVTAVLRVPMPRVQTALRFQPLEQGMPVPAALDAARRRAQEQAAADAQRLSERAGRAADVAAAEAMALADPATPCVLALVVQAERAGLDAMAARPDVRAVHAAPTGVTARELALSPLLPEQVEHADPLPDDGQPPS